ncbi:hypothetical protein [Thermomonospora umbrina]|uniref:Uncharacterized protein n=1 Tax=Thermomonospora umbrina TaxID=111806 RepID=A0A3D9T4W8_9ACTN|nr:hypothetical protein [Thermomonospora umbrina]REF00286.1 hypothetical protein DFJ69_5816 [Thermomonospora umbrina]
MGTGGLPGPLDNWITADVSSDAVRRAVMAWIPSRYEDPFRDAKRVARMPNYWHARIPASRHGDGLIVTCSYWIDVKTRTVTCDLFGVPPEDTLE